MDEDYSPTKWRLLDTGARDGATNMAIDEAILESVAAGRGGPTLRFYAWGPPCVSIGFGQPISDVDRAACLQRGWDVIRRPSGGRAILHVDELTYSVCAAPDEPRVAGGIVESYGRLVAGLLAGLCQLGLEPAESKPEYAPEQEAEGPVCFDGPARYEITVAGRKLVGSAQARPKGGILQHGTMPLTGDITRIIDGLVWNGPAARRSARQRLSRRALTLQEALGRAVAFEEAVEAMTIGFRAALNLTLVPGELSAEEWDATERIRREKYTSDSWTSKTC
jgi:lipoyl(octanoyl) transferase